MHRSRTSAAVLAVCAGLLLTTAPAAGAAAAPHRPSSAAVAATAPAESRLQIGSRGEQVRSWQALLNRIHRAGAVSGTTVAENGVYGPATARATRTVQAHVGLVQDGVVGPRTRRAVSGLGFAAGVGGVSPSSDQYAGHRRLSTGMRGEDVRSWQHTLNTAIDLGRLDAARVTEDGVYRSQTRDTTRALQRALSVTVDGVVGPVTREATGWLLEG